MSGWNPWHGCRKVSEGCLNCYVYRMDERFCADASVIKKTSAFDLPIRQKKSGEYIIPPGETVFTCFTSDFFIEEADEWRKEAWKIIRARSDLNFFIITKRIERFYESLPDDWENGYKNVTIGCTVENNRQAKRRLGIFLNAPIVNREIVCSPLLEEVDLWSYLDERVKRVTVGGESGENARVCDFEWILGMYEQCREKGIPFSYYQTGAKLKKDGKIYRIPRKFQHSQAKKAADEYGFEIIE